MNQTFKANGWALIPLGVFLVVYLLTSIIVGDFYKVPITVAFVISSIVSIIISKGTLNERIEHFSKGAANPNIMLMVWIFILAGAFAQTAKSMGAVDATVNLALNILPDNLLIAGIFISACFISLSVGTSVGTIVALVPVAMGIAEKASLELPFMMAVVIGGAFFGDNLSFISDTTIAATKTQGCEMKDKFRVNSMIVLPVALIMCIIYIYIGLGVNVANSHIEVEWIKVIPYILVLGTAIAGMNVMLVLLLGMAASTIVGITTGSLNFFDCFGAMGEGIVGMGELSIITLLAGGMLELIRRGGGIQFIIDKLTNKVNSVRAAEFSIAGLVSFANLCTANNTIAVITIGPIAKSIADKFGIDSRKSASLLDTFSCFVQGIIPYGAQLLIASSLAKISPLSIIEYLYYPFLMGIAAILAIIFRYPRRYSVKEIK
ncbi:MAG: Na+/H+ antiporter NhaC family protein [Bacteroidales bacterium]|nr:Na+/H+ antiporter NhaC family protein [Bacteroidales bacterium]